MEATLRVLNELERDGVISRYAIGGAVGAIFYMEERFPPRSARPSSPNRKVRRMEKCEIEQLFAAKQRRRHELARLPIEEKLRAVVRLQEMAAPILRKRGTAVRCWKLEPVNLA